VRDALGQWMLCVCSGSKGSVDVVRSAYCLVDAQGLVTQTNVAT
jgi:hypothetical protein